LRRLWEVPHSAQYAIAPYGLRLTAFTAFKAGPGAKNAHARPAGRLLENPRYTQPPRALRELFKTVFYAEYQAAVMAHRRRSAGMAFFTRFQGAAAARLGCDKSHQNGIKLIQQAS